MQRVDIKELSFKSDEDEYCDDYFAFYEGKPFTDVLPGLPDVFICL